ncbi:MAG TPA: NrfD/PsrC family molybdoenzyme membrane anchor subunit [Methylomirabilota bacterium]|jgi:formate-dependent nitrite reductase membrane component NrfD|nr:NrfD/PsrC family molybdoenzyme membrane anchor subunit [Methylomirabilota bacterium]
MPQHFVAPPQWEWYIVWYFFLGGLAGGAYLIGTLLRLLGDPRDEGAARLAFLVAFPAMAICPLLLTLDLGHPLRFWHMMVNSRTWALNFKYWSPMSVGAWALLGFGLFATLSFIEALVRDGRLGHPIARGIAAVMGGALGRVFMVVGALLGLFVAGYTGVLLSVSNQPIWSDTWALGGLFLASGLSVSAATLAILARTRADASATEGKLTRADRIFIVLELVLLVAFFATLGALAGRLFAPRWIVLWLLVAIGTLVPLAMSRTPSAGRRGSPVLAGWLVLLGGLALRIVVVFGAQM